MNDDFLLFRKRAGELWLKRKGEGRAKRVCTVNMACNLLKRSQRQIYRYVRSGELIFEGKVLSELLIDYDSVLRMAGAPLTKQPIPARLKRHFPEYSVNRLNVGRDRTLIIGRLLEHGTLSDLRWLFMRYSRDDIFRFMKRDGYRLLSKRSMNLWTHILNMPSQRRENHWRQRAVNPWFQRET